MIKDCCQLSNWKNESAGTQILPVKIAVTMGLIVTLVGICLLGLSHQSLSSGLNTLSSTAVAAIVGGPLFIGVAILLLLSKPRTPPLTPEIKQEMKEKLPPILPSWSYEAYTPTLISALEHVKQKEVTRFKYDKVFIAYLNRDKSINLFEPDGQFSNHNEEFICQTDISRHLLILVLNTKNMLWVLKEGQSQQFLNEQPNLLRFQKNHGQIVWIKESEWNGKKLYSLIAEENLS